MPVYNRQDFLEQTLKSIESQTYTNWELIVVDDGSNDRSVELIEHFVSKNNGKGFLIRSPIKQSGAGACRNLGLKYVKGEYIIFLDSDDLFEPRCIEQRMKVMETEPQLSFAVFLQKTFQADPSSTNGIFNRLPGFNDSHLNLFLRSDIPWSVHAVIWKKEALIKLGGFDPAFYVMEDPDLHVRALLDDELIFRVCGELPPDSLYRVGNMDGEKSTTFYRHSILYRFLFLKKSFGLIRASNLPLAKKRMAAVNWSKGVDNLFRHFLLSRVGQFRNETDEFLDWARCNRALGTAKQFKFRMMVTIWGSNHVLIKRSRLRGVLYRILYN